MLATLGIVVLQQGVCHTPYLIRANVWVQHVPTPYPPKPLSTFYLLLSRQHSLLIADVLGHIAGCFHRRHDFVQRLIHCRVDDCYYRALD